MREESKIALIVAVVSLVTTIAGTMLGSYFTRSQWEAQSSLEQRRAIIDQRIHLIERLSVLMNSTQRPAILQKLFDAEASIAQAHLACITDELAKKPVPKFCDEKQDPLAVLPAHQEMVKLNADYASTLQLAAIYFGQKTRQAISDLPKNVQWWEQKPNAVLMAMQDELTQF